MIEEIVKQLRALSEDGYAAFQRKLIPTVAPEHIIGVRTPALRLLARDLLKGDAYKPFLNSLPHSIFEENQLHAFLIAGIADFDECMEQTERFLPYVDNWATCDQMSPRVFRKHHQPLLERIRLWIGSDHEYTVRFAIGMLMSHFLDDDCRPEYMQMVASVKRDEYYIRMMQAWYFATALAKHYDWAIDFFTTPTLDRWTHNKAIQKAIESRRVSEERKNVLRQLRQR